MSKIVLSQPAGGFNLSAINQNFQKIQDEFNNKVLYRQNPTGEPNQMVGSNLDMGSNHILNLPAPTSMNEAARLKDVVDAIAGAKTAALTSFSPYSQITATNVQGAIQQVEDSVVTISGNSFTSVKNYGAKGDGTTDDTAAIQAANAAGIPFYFPPGTYLANNLVLTIPFTMNVGSVIKYNGTNAATDVIVSFNGSNQTVGNVYIDANNLDPLTQFLVNGNYNTFDAVHVSNQVAFPASLANGGVKAWGNGNRFKSVYGTNLTNTGNSNVSIPQLMTFGQASTDNIVNLLDGYNIRAGVVAFSTGAINFVDHASYREIQDNGCYMTQGFIAMKTMLYDGYDEPLVSIGGGGDFGTVIVSKASGDNAVLGVNANSNITIGEIILSGTSSPSMIIRSRGTGATSVGKPIRIGRISGDFYGNVLVYLNDTNNLESISIGSMDVTWYYNPSFIVSGILEFSAALRVNLGNINVKIIDLTNAISTVYMNLNQSIAYASSVGNIAVSLYGADGITPSASGSFLARYLFQNKVTYTGTGNLHNSLAALQRWDNTIIPSGGGLFATAVPTAGTWKRGQVVYRLVPSASASPGWVCVSAGTPGTWVQMANLQAT